MGGQITCKRVIAEVDREIAAEKQLEKLKHAVRKHLSYTERLSLLRKEYIALMTKRYGAEFDNDELMAPFRMYSTEVYNRMCGSGQIGGIDASHGRSPNHVVCNEDTVRLAEEALRSSAQILDQVRDGGYQDKVASLPSKNKRKNMCKLCGQYGHYAKVCPQLETSKVNSQRENMSKAEFKSARRREMLDTQRTRSVCKRPAGGIARHEGNEQQSSKKRRASLR